LLCLSRPFSFQQLGC